MRFEFYNVKYEDGNAVTMIIFEDAQMSDESYEEFPSGDLTMPVELYEATFKTPLSEIPVMTWEEFGNYLESLEV